MITIGLTGGIGSGKTTVDQIIHTLGFPVYISDTKASILMNNDSYIREQLKELFGEETYTQANTLNKAYLAAIIFNDKEAIQKVNRIVHPIVMRDFESWGKQKQSTILFFESAILFEAGLNTNFDHIITVTAEINTRIDRVMNRDHLSREAIKERINNQYDDTIKCKQSDFIIHNDHNSMLLDQILSIIEKIKK